MIFFRQIPGYQQETATGDPKATYSEVCGSMCSSKLIYISRKNIDILFP